MFFILRSAIADGARRAFIYASVAAKSNTSSVIKQCWRLRGAAEPKKLCGAFDATSGMGAISPSRADREAASNRDDQGSVRSSGK
jgi:hypothetical protein